MRVGTDHKTTREGVVFKNDLVNDARPWSPESETVFGSGRCQKVVNLPVDIFCTLEILDTSNLGLDKVVAVNGGRNRSGVHARRHELENGHLCMTLTRSIVM